MSKKLAIVLSAASIAAIAMICHEANAAYCRSLGDDSQKSWSEAPDWQRTSIINGVEFHLANPDAGDAASHENWLKMKEADGWKYGEVKDEAAKTHPCMVPFDQLPPAQQFKDALVRTIIHAAAPAFAQVEDEIKSLSENQDKDLPSSEQDEAVKAAFARLGLVLDPGNGMSTEDYLAAINGVADRIEGLEGDNAKLAAAAAKAKSAPAAKSAKAASAREVAPVKLKKGEEPQVGPHPSETYDELLELIGMADTVEVAFSNGKTEIAGIPALVISGDAWRKTMAGLELTGVGVTVHGPAHGQSPFTLHGYGLLLDGKQAAYRTRPEQLTIAAGASFDLSGDIVF